jgi:hypothetical protein
MGRLRQSRLIISAKKLIFSSVGSASIASDGTTIRMRLRATTEDGAIGDALILVPNTDPTHQKIKDNLKDLEIKQSVSVPAFSL